MKDERIVVMNLVINTKLTFERAVDVLTIRVGRVECRWNVDPGWQLRQLRGFACLDHT